MSTTETIYHSSSSECPPGKHDIIPFVDGNGVVGICCQRCGKRTYENKNSAVSITKDGALETRIIWPDPLRIPE